ncbi:polymorphic toxin-type HINT domain-containing protein, partial [Kitasatospora sp. NPDC091257]|uniref:polymorphic toxin-type HINT domain-containing protein n=1 Tax=Kitasatospora sp. NPDC091257 TaxID=3364084 RepID=UPI0037F33FCE
PRGKKPATWPTERGFVGGTNDATTGLTHLGARDYDPANGRFISVDPVLDLTDPQQINGYAYSNNNPVNLSDPSGLRPDGTCGGTAACRTTDGHLVNEAWGLQDGGWTVEISKSVLAYLPGGIGLPEIPDYQSVLKQTVKNLDNLFRDHTRFGKPGAEKEDQVQYRAAALNACQVVAACSKSNAYNTLWDQRMGWEFENFAPFGPGEVLNGALNAKAAAKAIGRPASKSVGSRPSCDSFPPDTLVLMADGTTKPIGDIGVGDIVAATDPQSGQTAKKTVTDKIVTPDDTRFTELTLSASGTEGPSSAPVNLVSTAHHPYWDDTARQWILAEDLQTGHSLLTPGHGPLVVVAAHTYTTQPQVAHNLTVADLHTYYVLAGNTPVLVHNSACDRFSNLEPNDPVHPMTPMSLGSLQGATGKFIYVVMPGGELRVTRLGGQYGHIDLAQGADVVAAGEFKMYSGRLKEMDNRSGHYQPSGDSARNAAEEAFRGAGFDVGTKTYKERW